MKRLLLFVLLVLLLTSCGKPAAKKIGVMWYTKSVMAEQVYAAFEKRLQELAPEVDIELQAGIPDIETATSVYQRFAEEKDGVVFMRSQGARYLVMHPIDKPGFIGAANDPVDLGVLEALDAAPEKNITGVSYYIDITRKLQVFKTIFPEIQKVGLLLWEEHPATPIEWEGTEKGCDQIGLTLDTQICTTDGEVAAAAEKMGREADLIIISSANRITDLTAAIMLAAGATPVVSFAENSVEAGALAGLTSDDAKLGGYLAEIVHKVIVQGVSVHDVPVRYDEEPLLLVNRKAMKKYGVELPESLQSTAKFID